MINSMGEIDDNLKQKVCRYFEENNSFSLLKEQFPFLDHNILFSILYSANKYANKIYNYLPQETISDQRIILISDTHYGSIYENMTYTYDVFDFAIKQGINIILHGGDIIEANLKARDNLGILDQADYFIDKYPYDYHIKTYALLGNHDYSAIKINKNVKRILSSRDDISILGFKKVYLKWLGNIISLKHEIENFKVDLPVNAEYISFRGHSHFYHINDKKGIKSERVFIPAMCDDPIPYTVDLFQRRKNKINIKPGFLVAEIDNNNILVMHYAFQDSQIIKENEYVKKLKK